MTRDRDGEPLLAKIASHVNHEGKGFILMREDGSQETTDFKKVSGEIRIDLNDVQRKGEAAIDDALASASKQLLETQKKMLFESLDRTVPKHDAGGKPFSAEILLETWEMMEFSFDENGNWQRPDIVINPIQAPRLEKELKRLHSEDDLKKRLEDLIERKKSDWNDREANRKLVD
jgi:hypothetical protein